MQRIGRIWAQPEGAILFTAAAAVITGGGFFAYRQLKHNPDVHVNRIHAKSVDQLLPTGGERLFQGKRLPSIEKTRHVNPPELKQMEEAKVK